MKRVLRLVILMAGLLAAKGVLATTYYVDYSNGNDSWDGLSKDNSLGGNHGPWKNAPGMCNATCGPSLTINPGDSIIFKGCVTWPNASFSWHPPFNGSSGNPIYVGIDKSWWDTSVSGCSSAWNRPIFDPNGKMFADGSNSGQPWQQLIWSHDYITYDGFEIRNFFCAGNVASHQMVVFAASGQSVMNVTIKNVYIHGWKTDYANTTGTIASGSSTLTVASAANMYVGEPLGVYYNANLGQVLPTAGNGTHITAMNGNIISLDGSASRGDCAATPCAVWASEDSCNFVYMNVNDGDNNVLEESIIDGSDSDIVQLDSNCSGACTASGGRSVYATPSTLKNNIFRYVSNGPILSHGREVAGNLIEYIRLSVNPYLHTNGFEDNSDSLAGLLFYNNVVRHLNVNNATGQRSVGVLVWLGPQAGASNATYMFNNVLYDTIQNGVSIARALATPNGTAYVFNNSMSCGPDWNIGFSCMNVSADCSSGGRTCYFNNNHFITANSSALGGTCSPPICNADATNVVQTPSTAQSQGYSENSAFAWIPSLSSGATVNKGINYTNLRCPTAAVMSAAAGLACLSDTAYGPSYNPTTHWITPYPPGGRANNLRAPTGNWDIGAYTFAATTSKPAPPTGLAAIVQ